MHFKVNCKHQYISAYVGMHGINSGLVHTLGNFSHLKCNKTCFMAQLMAHLGGCSLCPGRSVSRVGRRYVLWMSVRWLMALLSSFIKNQSLLIFFLWGNCSIHCQESNLTISSFDHGIFCTPFSCSQFLFCVFTYIVLHTRTFMVIMSWWWIHLFTISSLSLLIPFVLKSILCDNKIM